MHIKVLLWTIDNLARTNGMYIKGEMMFEYQNKIIIKNYKHEQAYH